MCVCSHAQPFGQDKRKLSVYIQVFSDIGNHFAPSILSFMDGSHFKTANQKSLNTLPLYKCSHMLIRCKIIYKHFAWFYMGRKFIMFIYDAHIIQDNGNHIKLYKGNNKSGQDPPTWLLEVKTQNMLGPLQSHYLF